MIFLLLSFYTLKKLSEC